MESLDDVKFKMTIPYNNPVLVKDRKKTKILLASCCLFATLFFGTLLILSLVISKKSIFATVVFAILTIISLSIAVVCFATIKQNEKDKDKSIQYTFYENYLEITQQGGKKNKCLKSCLYKKYKDKQYVKKLVERNDRLQIIILTGYLNLVPQYEKFVIPMPKKSSEKVENFKTFLKEKVTKYIVKK